MSKYKTVVVTSKAKLEMRQEVRLKHLTCFEEANQPKAFQMHQTPTLIRLDGRDWTQAGAVEIDQAVGFEPC